MILQLIVGCVLFSLGSGNYLEFVPGENPNESSLEFLESEPSLSETFIPIWAETMKVLAANEDRVKFVFRFFNRPNHYRYVLDIILLLGNLDIPDEGYLPYFKREDAMAALKPLIDERKGFPEFSVGQHTEDILEASHFPEADVESITEYLISQSKTDADEGAIQSTEHGIDTSTEYVVYPSIDGGEGVSQSTSHETNSLEYMIQKSKDDGQEAQSAESATESSTGYVIYPSTVAEEEVSKSMEPEIELSEYLGHQSVEHTSSEENSGEFERRSGPPYRRHPPHGYRVHYPDHHGSERSSEEDSEEEFEHRSGYRRHHPHGYMVHYYPDHHGSEEDSEEELEHRVGLSPQQFQTLSEQVTRDEDDSSESSEEEDEHGEDEHIPGVNFPDYADIPITSFSCAGRVPGFYADVETECQTFHVCYPTRNETFICPTGTIFIQRILACDYSFNNECSEKSSFEDNARIQEPEIPAMVKNKIENLEGVVIALPSEHPTQSPTPLSAIDWSQFIEILPAKSKVVVYPQSTLTAAVKRKPVVHVKKSKPLPKRKVEDSKKADALQIMKEMLVAAENMAKNAQPLLSQVASIGYLPVESVRGIKHSKLIRNPPPVPKFVVKPASLKRPQEVVRKQSRIGETVLVAEDSTAEEIWPVKAHKVEPKLKPDVPEIVMSALEMAGAVLSEDILPFTRQALMENYLKHAKVKLETKPVRDYVPEEVTSTLEHVDIKHTKVEPKSKSVKDHVPEVVMSALEMAGAVLNEDILPFTRQALMENYIKHAKVKLETKPVRDYVPEEVTSTLIEKHTEVEPESKSVKDPVPEIVMVENVINENILPLTRRALMENYI